MWILPVLLMCTAGLAQDEPGTARPTPEQAAWQDMELGMFIHFAPNTWQDSEGDKRTTPLDKINPASLNTDQWVQVAESMGAKYIVFVVKHVGGFCMWQTDTTKYGIKETPWKNGKGDVLGDLSESCKKRGMKLGLYISPRDDTLGAETAGRCRDALKQKEYDAIYRQQLTEVLSRYGEMAEVWFDGSTIAETGDILRQYAPKAAIFQSKHATIRWVGNEDGKAPYPAWNAVSREAWQKGATAADGNPKGEIWLPNECDARMRQDWFWNSKNAKTLKSVDQLMDMYYQSVGHGAVLLLNATPDTTGQIPEMDVKRAAEFGTEIQRRFGKSIAETSGSGETIMLDIGTAKRIDHVISMEDILQGERVHEYILEARTNGNWTKLCEGSSIGHKKIDRFKPVTADTVRLRITKSAGEPIVHKLAAYCAEESSK
jgi:alpha-L-fucosidase